MLVNYTKPGVHNADGVLLKPGVNQVDIKKWAVARKHPIVKIMIEHGDITEETEFEHAQKMTDAENKVADESILSPMKIPQAKALIEETVDLDLLNRWKQVEKRNQVVGAINSQIEKLQAPAEEREKGSHQKSLGLTVKETQVTNPGDVE